MGDEGRFENLVEQNEPKWWKGMRSFFRFFWMKAHNYFSGMTSYLIDLADWSDDMRIEVGALSSRLEKMIRAVCDISNRLANVEKSVTLVLQAIEKIEKHLDVDISQAEVYDFGTDIGEVKELVQEAKQNKVSDGEIEDVLLPAYGEDLLREAMKTDDG